jgi:hypothetical protein
MRGGKRPGAGRPRRSTRIMLATVYAFLIEEIRGQAEREGHKCNPAKEAYYRAYAIDHPLMIRGGKIRNLEHFDRYCNTQKQLRRMGKRDLKVPPDQDFTTAATEAFLKDVVGACARAGLLSLARSDALAILKQLLPGGG